MDLNFSLPVNSIYRIEQHYTKIIKSFTISLPSLIVMSNDNIFSAHHKNHTRKNTT